MSYQLGGFSWIKSKKLFVIMFFVISKTQTRSPNLKQSLYIFVLSVFNLFSCF
jgi:hypothetical protein